MSKMLAGIAGLLMLLALALPTPGNAAPQGEGITKGDITDVSSRRYKRRYYRGYRVVYRTRYVPYGGYYGWGYAPRYYYRPAYVGPWPFFGPWWW